MVRETYIRKERKFVRELHIGVPSLCALTKRNIASVLSHEYGHFINGDTKALKFVYLMLSSLNRMLEIHGQYGFNFKINPVFWFMEYFRIVFINYFLGYSRLNEYLADFVSINTFGSENFIDSLERFIKISTIYQTVLERSFYNFYNSNFKKSIDSPYNSHLYERNLNKEELDYLSDDLVRKSKIGDTHPSFLDRCNFSKLLSRQDWNHFPNNYINIETIEQDFIKDLTLLAQTYR